MSKIYKVTYCPPSMRSGLDIECTSFEEVEDVIDNFYEMEIGTVKPKVVENTIILIPYQTEDESAHEFQSRASTVLVIGELIDREVRFIVNIDGLNKVPTKEFKEKMLAIYNEYPSIHVESNGVIMFESTDYFNAFSFIEALETQFKESAYNITSSIQVGTLS
jgi:hypothetical protein